jgi:peptidoglycan hydrolase-like protein with peptidoglycan-binding domain
MNVKNKMKVMTVIIASILTAQVLATHHKTDAMDKAKQETNKERSVSKEMPNQDRISQVQKALKDKGYKVSEMNGKLSTETKAALKKFQKDNGLEATGRLNQETIVAMGLDTTKTPAEDSSAYSE